MPSISFAKTNKLKFIASVSEVYFIEEHRYYALGKKRNPFLSDEFKFKIEAMFQDQYLECEKQYYKQISGEEKF